MKHASPVRVVIVSALTIGLLAATVAAFEALSVRSDATLACLSHTSLLMSEVAEIDGFAIDVDKDLPVIDRGSAPGEQPPAYVADYQSGHITGYLSAVAIHGPDRAELDAVASSLSYPIGRLPLVPLEGPIVEHNQGLLEVYVTVRAFKSETGVRSWLSSKSAAFAQSHYAVAPSPDKRIALAITGSLGPDDGLHEHILIYEVTSASSVLELAYQGGSGLSETIVAPETDTAIQRFGQACGPE
jgi:hypothetical protein